MKGIDDEHARLFRALLDRKRRPTGCHSLLVFWLDGDVGRAREWIRKHKLRGLRLAIVPRERRDVRAWRIDPAARNTFVTARNDIAYGTFVNASVDDFAKKMAKAIRPGPVVTALASRLTHADPQARLQAARALGWMGCRARDATAALRAAEHDESAAVRAAALRALQLVLR